MRSGQRARANGDGPPTSSERLAAAALFQRESGGAEWLRGWEAALKPAALFPDSGDGRNMFSRTAPPLSFQPVLHDLPTTPGTTEMPTDYKQSDECWKYASRHHRGSSHRALSHQASHLTHPVFLRVPQVLPHSQQRNVGANPGSPLAILLLWLFSMMSAHSEGLSVGISYSLCPAC